jgi:hypothetical protein
VRTGDAEGKVGAGLQLPHCLRVERALYPGPRAGDLVQRCGVDNLVRRLPDPRVLEDEWRLVGRRMRGLPVDPSSRTSGGRKGTCRSIGCAG